MPTGRQVEPSEGYLPLSALGAYRLRDSHSENGASAVSVALLTDKSRRWASNPNEFEILRGYENVLSHAPVVTKNVQKH
jgi:hypothetical protein